MDLTKADITFGNLAGGVHGAGTIPIRVAFGEGVDTNYVVIGTPNGCAPDAVGFAPITVTLDIANASGPPWPVLGCAVLDGVTVSVGADASLIQQCGPTNGSSNIAAAKWVDFLKAELTKAMSGSECTRP